MVTSRSATGPDGNGDYSDLVERVAQAVLGGVDMVQLREKDLAGRELLTLADALLEAIDGRAMLLVNERADVALAAGARGVQLGEEGLPVRAARKTLGNGGLIGRSVHTERSALQAEADGADFLIVGTMFPSQSHPGETPSGPGLMGRISENSRLPLIGIGGITPENAATVIEAGASGVAVITNILAAPDPAAAAAELKQVLRQACRLGGGGAAGVGSRGNDRQ
ncbi:MAG: thiamine-phosphate diphosphorylase [SAR202 cluster bacterium Casp-Chloro-G2]|nr:MAG: thiamine-phosphate diphosphorylase [SAR202 cluster bacterium Casp-Chloro-G2]